MPRVLLATLSFAVFSLSQSGCQMNSSERSGANLAPTALSGIVQSVAEHADAIVLESDGGSVLVSPALQGRILTASVGEVASTGYVPLRTIAEGETHEHFNNFGGLDRFWLGPEAGQYGLYFPVGAQELTRDNWQVPAAFDKGAFEVVEKTARRVDLRRGMRVVNHGGVEFDVRVDRTVGVLSRSEISRELGLQLPESVAHVGCYSANRLTNAGDRTWSAETGLVGIWILGMFNATDESVVIAPVRPGDEASLGTVVNDDYFGKVREEYPDRLKVVGDHVLFRGDARQVGKFGLGQGRTTGFAGAYDFSRDLLTLVHFDVDRAPRPETRAKYANSTWVLPQPEPYGGDAFQSYNNGGEQPGELAADVFYEIESASPVEELTPGESIEHRHATFSFQGPRADLAAIARTVLGVDLDVVAREMGGGGG